MNPRVSRSLGLATLVVAGAQVLLAQAPTAPQATFRGGIELVGVDFIATTADGTPVTDLQMDEVTVRVDRRPREIRQLQFVRLATEDTAASTPATPRPLVQPPFGTNRAGESGRTVIVVFDDSTISPGNERAPREAAIRFLDRLSPGDRVALATQARVEVDLTTDHARVSDAIRHVAGHGAGGSLMRPNGGTGVTQGGPPLVWFRTFLQSLKALDGPKTVVLIAESAPAVEMNPDVAREYAEIAKIAGEVSAQLYVIQPQNFAVSASRTSEDLGVCSTCTGDTYAAGQDASARGLEDLSTVTGGELFRLSGEADRVFQKIARQSAAYYLLGFQPDASERNGKSHRIDITSSRPGVTIRSRFDFTIPKSTTSETAPPTLVQMLQNSKVYRDVPFRVAAYAQRGTGKNLNIVVTAESAEDGTTFAEMSFGLIDLTSHRMTLAWAGPPEVKGSPRVLSGAAVPPAAYRVRVATVSPDGRRGAAEYDFDARLTTAGPLMLSDLMVGQGKPDGTFEPLLEFKARASATGFLELYGTLPQGTALSVGYELVRAKDDVTLFRVPGIIMPTPQADRWTARGALPIGSVPAGDYFVRASIAVDGQVVGRASRLMRKAN